MRFRKTVALIALVILLAAPWLAAGPGNWTGLITDSHCGKYGTTKDHTAAMLERCVKSGAKPQILNETDGKLYHLDSLEKLKELVGSKVTIKGTLDTASNTIKVESATKAGDSKK